MNYTSLRVSRSQLIPAELTRVTEVRDIATNDMHQSIHLTFFPNTYQLETLYPVSQTTFAIVESNI